MSNKGFRSGFDRGLGEGAEGSGLLLGFFVPLGIAGLVIALIVAVGAWANGCFNPKPAKVCTNYSFGVGYIDRETMACNRWPAMQMRIEKRLVKEDIVHCTCTAESFPPPKK